MRGDALRRGHAARAHQALAPDVLVKGGDYHPRTPSWAPTSWNPGAGAWCAFPCFPVLHHRLSWSVFVPRPDGRTTDQLRPVVLERGANPYAEGSCLVRFGGTLVHCTACVEAGAPGFKKGTGEGWVTAEYAMLPRATWSAPSASGTDREAGPRRSSG